MKKSFDHQFKVIEQIHDQNLREQLTRAYKRATELAMLLLLLTPEDRVLFVKENISNEMFKANCLNYLQKLQK